MRTLKTILPSYLDNLEQAKQYLSDLYNNNESYHPDDSAGDCLDIDDETAEKMDLLMDRVFELAQGTDFDVYFFILGLDPEYKPENFPDDSPAVTNRIPKKNTPAKITEFKNERYIIRERFENGPWTIEEITSGAVIGQIEQRNGNKVWLFATYCESFTRPELLEIESAMQRVDNIIKCR